MGDHEPSTAAAAWGDKSIVGRCYFSKADEFSLHLRGGIVSQVSEPGGRASGLRKPSLVQDLRHGTAPRWPRRCHQPNERQTHGLDRRS